MVEQSNWVQNDQENCVDNSIRVNSTISLEPTDQIATAALNKSQSKYPKGYLVSMGPESSVSACTDINASGVNNGSLDIDITPEHGSGSSGPPSNIIQQFDDDSEQIITLDSIQDSERESDASDFNGASTKGCDKTSWLNIDSSSTSQGSQGSYAHQVPELLGSYGSNGINIDQQPGKSIVPLDLPSPKFFISEQFQSAHSRSTSFQNLEKPQNSNNTNNTNLTDILGPKGEPLLYGLALDGEPLQSDLDDILGPQSDGKPSDLDDTLGPYDGSTIGPSVPPCEHTSMRGFPETSGQRNSTSIDNTVRDADVTQVPESSSISEVTKKMTDAASISEKHKPQVQNEKNSSMQQLHHQSVSEVFSEPKSILEYKETNFSQISKSSVDSSMWDASNGVNFNSNSYSHITNRTLSSQVSTSADYTFSDSQRDSFSTRDHTMQSLVSSDVRTLSQGDSRSGANQLSTEEYSQLSRTKYSQFSDTEYTSGTQYSHATLTDGTGSRSRINQLSTEESSLSSPTKHSQFNDTEDESGTNYTFATSTNVISPKSRTNQYSSTKHSRTEHTTGTHVFSTTSSNAICSLNDSEDFNWSKGGRVWREAQLQANGSEDMPPSPRAKKFAESIMAKTRSRADTNALLNDSSNIDTIKKPTRSMINVNAQEEGRFIRSTATARKRGRVVQLLTIGLLSFLIAFLGGFLVSLSCYFVSAIIQVGDNAEEFDLHFGLWKYSPAESASQGYNYCSNYDGDFIDDAPWLGRLSSLVALLGGGFSLGVLWLYLVFGRCVKNIWNTAVCAAAISGVLQLSTLSILFGTICNKQVCTLGPAGIISIVAGFCYFVLAFEMYHNAPLVNHSDTLAHFSSREEPHHVVTNLEMTDFEYGVKAYIQRISFGDANPYPALHHSQNRNQNRISDTVQDRGDTSYVPPSAIV